MSEDNDRACNQIAWGIVATAALWSWLARVLSVSAAAFLALNRHGRLGGRVLPPRPLAPWLLHLVRDEDLGLLLFGLSAATLLRWFYVVGHNAHLLVGTSRYRPRYKPRAAVIWFFAPFANLIRPFQVVLECWQISRDPSDPSRVAVPILLRWWWGLWLLAITVDYALSKLYESVWIEEELPTIAWLTTARAFVQAPLVIVLTLVILRLSAMQRAAFARRHSTLHGGNGVVA